MTFVKGFGISQSKLVGMIGCDPIAPQVNAAVDSILARVDRDVYHFAVGYISGRIDDGMVIIVLDEDEDKEKLRKSLPTTQLDASLEWLKRVLEGPDVWEKALD